MAENQDKVNSLLNKIELLLEKQDSFAKEINGLKEEISILKVSDEKLIEEDVPQEIVIENKIENVTTEVETVKQDVNQKQTKKQTTRVNKPPKISLNLEKFIGENLINKIGIIITVIGVAIGAKYSIEHELISPLTRIILGYLAGLGLLSIGIKLKKNYNNYSAVLVSGAIAIMYFITYASYSFYDLIPSIVTFALMVIFTIFTVIAAISYSNQVIALIGLVGAYAIPFLLKEISENIPFLFIYMAIINCGIIFISFKKYWKPVFYSAFGLTWFIYIIWFASQYHINENFAFATIFLLIFFVTFYLSFLAYKLLQKEKFNFGDIILILSNSFIFYSIGYAILSTHNNGKELLGLFTLANAIIHFIVSAVIYKHKLADRNLFYLVSGLVLVFITIAIPIQLDGNWVTLLWVGEAALLFWIGRTKNVYIYEYISYILMITAFVSIAHDWISVYNNYVFDKPETRITSFFNIHFLTSILFIASFTLINIINRNKKYSNDNISKIGLDQISTYAMLAILLFTIYFSFRMEIVTYWNQLYTDSSVPLNLGDSDFIRQTKNSDLITFKRIWIINYSLLFVSVLSFVNFKKIKDQLLGYINFSLTSLIIVIFLLQGLLEFSNLREIFIDRASHEYYQISVFYILIRYVSFAFLALAISSLHKFIKQDYVDASLKIYFDCLLFLSILWIVSSELIQWMDFAKMVDSYKLGLSILWGVYSLMLISLGLWKKKKYLRIGAISLFGVTLVKLFFYDISHLNTISKTIVFVSLGILLLIISFLYNKYKHIITNEDES